MLRSVPTGSADKAFDALDADVLPTLSALLGSVKDAAKVEPQDSYEARGAELRDMTRQIIELTRFLAAVADHSAQSAEARIRA